MTTITSPRPSFTSLAPTATPSSSRRPSLDTPLPSRSQNPSPSRPAFNQNPNLNPTRERRNRAALRDYYGLKNSSLGEGEKGKQEEGDADGGGEGKESELDAEGFDAEAYVRGVLGREGLEGVLRVEGGLVAGMSFILFCPLLAGSLGNGSTTGLTLVCCVGYRDQGLRWGTESFGVR